MAKGKGKGGGTPPPDKPPAGNEYRLHEVVKTVLQPGEFGTIGIPTQGKRIPEFIGIEKIPPGFYPGEEVAVKVEYVNPRRASGVVVGPEHVVKEIEKQLGQALTESEQYWKDTLMTGTPPNVTSDRIQKREGRDGIPQFYYEFIDSPDHDYLPFEVFMANVPPDWDPKKEKKFEIEIKSIQIHNQKKILFGDAWVKGFPEPKLSPEQEARKYVNELLGEIRNPSGEHRFKHPLADAKGLMVKKEGRWIIPNIGDALYHAEVRLDVPSDWSPDQLVADPVEYEMTDARAEGAKVLIRAHILGLEPRKADAAKSKIETKAEKKFGQRIGEALNTMIPDDMKAALDALIKELDSPALAELNGITRRRDVLESILEQIAQIRSDLLEQAAAGDDDAVLLIPKLIEQRKKVEAEKSRTVQLIEDAKQVWGDEIAEIKKSFTAAQTERLARLEKMRPKVEVSALTKVYNLVHGNPDELGLSDLQDLDEVQRLQAENEVILKQKEKYIQDGLFPENPNDPDYVFSNVVEYFLVAELMVPEYENRIAELEQAAGGAKSPEPRAPAPTAAEIKLPGPIVVPESAPAPEPEKKLGPKEMMAELKQWHYGTGESMGFTAAAQRRLKKVFGLTQLPERLRIRNIAIPQAEVELELPDGTTGVISIEQVYRIAQEMVALSSALTAAEVRSNKMVELTDEAIATILRPNMADWTAKHPGKTMPKKFRFEGVDLVSGQALLGLEGVANAGVVRVPLEAFTQLVGEKKVKVVPGIAPLEVGPSRAGIDIIPPGGRRLERPLSAEVKPNQIWQYDGAPAEQLKPGGYFKIVSVDDEKGIVTVVTAKEDAAANREHRKPEQFSATRSQWIGMPKTFKSGPAPEKPPAPPKVERPLSAEVKPEQIWKHTGTVRTSNLIPGLEFKVIEVSDEEGFVRFLFPRERVMVEKETIEPKIMRATRNQWNGLPKTLVSAPQPGSPKPAPTPPPPPAPEPPPAATPAAEQITVPNSLTELRDLIKGTDLITKVKEELAKRAGLRDTVQSWFSDPFVDLTRRITDVANKSVSALAIGETYRERLLKDGSSAKKVEAAQAIANARDNYLNIEKATLEYITDQFNTVLKGKAAGTHEDRLKKLKTVEATLERLNIANEKGRLLLEAGTKSR